MDFQYNIHECLLMNCNAEK